MKYVLGLDIGMASVGWAILNYDKKRIEDMGVRGFEAAENPKNMSPLAKPRRIARSTRRRLRRLADRKKRAKQLFIDFGLIKDTERESAFLTTNLVTPWQLRYEGLDRLLSGTEFARALFHIAKHRGFKSNRKVEKESVSDNKKMPSGIGENREIMNKNHYRTAGEMMWLDEKFKNRKRNSPDQYEKTIDRELLEEEIKTLFSRQRELGSQFASEDFEQKFIEVFKWQKPFASGDDIIRRIGHCTLEKDEPRTAKYSYHAERANLFAKINSLSYDIDGEKIKLTDEQRKKAAELAYEKSKFSYSLLRKEFALPEHARFTGLIYAHKNKETGEIEETLKREDSDIFKLVGYKTLQKGFGKNGLWETVKSKPELMDTIIYALTFYKTDEDIRKYLEDKNVETEIIENVIDNCETLSKTSNLSLVALKKILPHLENGMQYSEACEAAGYNHSRREGSEKLIILPPIDDTVTNNPVVRRAFSQARKVVNEVIRRYGSPYRIHIELARDMGRSREQRRKIESRNKENERDREIFEKEFEDIFGSKPNGTDLLKYRLYKEQFGKCAYSQKNIDLNRLREPGYCEVDHILPYSRSFDDSRSNKALVLASENQKKRNQTPYEMFGHNENRWSEYENWVKTTIRDKNKRANLLRKKFDEKNEAEWKERHLQDTRWVSRLFSNFVKENLSFSDPQNKQPVVCVNGQIVATARWLWGLAKIREENDLHHALDAAIIAALLPHQVTLLTEYYKVKETRS